jgi:hypothetical protein
MKMQVAVPGTFFFYTNWWILVLAGTKQGDPYIVLTNDGKTVATSSNLIDQYWMMAITADARTNSYPRCLIPDVCSE